MTQALTTTYTYTHASTIADVPKTHDCAYLNRPVYKKDEKGPCLELALPHERGSDRAVPLIDLIHKHVTAVVQQPCADNDFNIECACMTVRTVLVPELALMCEFL